MCEAKLRAKIKILDIWTRSLAALSNIFEDLLFLTIFEDLALTVKKISF